MNESERESVPEEYDLDNPPWSAPEFGGDSDSWGDEEDRSDWYEAAARYWASRARGGRPAIGPVIQVRFPTDLLERVQAYADGTGQSRAEAIRTLVAGALG